MGQATHKISFRQLLPGAKRGGLVEVCSKPMLACRIEPKTVR